MDIYEKINDGFYQTNVKYPKRPQMICNKCEKLFGKDHKFCRECGANIQYQFENETAKYQANMKACQEDEATRHEMFKSDALAFVGLKPGKVADIIFSKAYNEGYSGYDELLQELEDITEFLNELKKAGF